LGAGPVVVVFDESGSGVPPVAGAVTVLPSSGAVAPPEDCVEVCVGAGVPVDTVGVVAVEVVGVVAAGAGVVSGLETTELSSPPQPASAAVVAMIRSGVVARRNTHPG
jgi:hypothetical protein